VSPMLQNLLFASIILGFAAMEFVTRRYQATVHANANDTKLELLMFLSLVAVAQPVAMLGGDRLGAWLMPSMRNAWSDLPWWAMVGILLVADDLTQYWWHRLSHTPLLWPLHRAHHSAKYMSIRITYRNNFFYYMLMPGLWTAGVLLYLGLGAVYLPYIVVKMTVILGAHCAWRWDEPLYRIRALRPVMWLVERTISTPATHWAHHALTNADGIGHYKGNFGNPAQVGLQDDLLFGEEYWADQMFYPWSQSTRAHSALRPGGKPYEEAGPEVAATAP
jgi:sterol desaturase/sphingolipid hydroxylase (fatty acid hydroxylase superfamily)